MVFVLTLTHIHPLEVPLLDLLTQRRLLNNPLVFSSLSLSFLEVKVLISNFNAIGYNHKSDLFIYDFWLGKICNIKNKAPNQKTFFTQVIAIQIAWVQPGAQRELCEPMFSLGWVSDTRHIRQNLAEEKLCRGVAREFIHSHPVATLSLNNNWFKSQSSISLLFSIRSNWPLKPLGAVTNERNNVGHTVLHFAHLEILGNTIRIRYTLF